MESKIQDASAGTVLPMPAAKPDLPEKPPSPSIEEWGDKFGTFLSLTLFSLGGGLLVSYYSHIHYLPDIKWEESMTYLFALAIFGSLLALLYALLLVVPGLIWSEGLVYDDLLVRGLCLKEINTYKPCVISISRRLAIPFALFMFVSHVSLFVDPPYLLWVIAPLSLACTCCLVWRNLNEGFKGLNSRQLARYVFIFSLSCLSGFGALFIFHWLVSSEGPMLGICMVTLVLTNISVSMVYRAHPRAVWAVGISAALLLLASGEALTRETSSRLSDRVMSFFGIGSGHPVTLVVNAKGLQTLKLYAIAQPNTQAPACVTGVEILSRLGSEFFLRYSSGNSKRDFSLGKDAVDSWFYQAEGLPAECVPSLPPKAGAGTTVESVKQRKVPATAVAEPQSSSP
jgi:hypothetical protein